MRLDVHRWTGGIGRRITRMHLKSLRYARGEKPIPLWYWLFFHRLIGALSSDPDLLFPPGELFHSTGASLKVNELKRLLINDTLGEWSLDTETISVIWQFLQDKEPRLVVECGAGISTLVLAQYAALTSSEGNPCLVVSLEQDFARARSILGRLNEADLGHFVRIVHSPLDARGNYSLGNVEKELARLPRKHIDALIIDGPSGASGCRLETLPMLLGHCREGTKWFLDDAFRDGEMRILDRWSRLDGVGVEGIYPIGKGLGVGFVGRPSSIVPH